MNLQDARCNNKDLKSCFETWANKINAVIKLQLITASQLTYFRYYVMFLFKKGHDPFQVARISRN